MTEQGLYSSRIAKIYIEYSSKHYPNVDVPAILDHAGMTIYQLNDGGHWFNQEQMDRFQEAIVKQTGNPDVSREVGRFAATSKAAGAMASYATGFIKPALVYGVMKKLYSQGSRACLIETRSLKGNHAEITVRLKSGIKEKPYQCANRWGMFEGIAKLMTGKLPKIDHSVCLHTGGDCCQYNITWETAPSGLWKRISGYAAVLSVLGFILMLIFFPFQYAVDYIAIALLIIFALFLRATMMERQELKDTLHGSGETAESLLNQINTLYNHAVLIKDIGQYASSILETDLLLKYFMSSLEKNLEFKRGVVLLANSDRTKLVYATGYGYSSETEEFLKKTEFSLDNPNSKGAFVVCYRKQTPLLIDDVSKVEGNFSLKSQEFAHKAGSRSFICVPIVYEGRSEGILAVDNLKTDRPLNETDISLLMGIAPQIGISINNARVYERLQEREQRFRILAESAPDIIFTMSPEGTFLYVNPALEKVLGFKREEVVGRSILKFVEGGDISRLAYLLERVSSNKETLVDVLVTIKSPAGIEHDFSFNCAPNVSEEGHVDTLVGIFKDMTDLRRSEFELKKSYDKLQAAMSGTISVISLISESRDPYTAGHQKRVAELAVAIAHEMGLSEEQERMIHMAGLIHDLGKINVPAEILSKPGNLNPGEFALIQNHPETGYNILSKVDFIPLVAQIVYQHHEQMDGSGYPRRISGDEIIPEARIVTVADVVEAMANHRPYRPALGMEKALDEIRNNRGAKYDADVVDACIALFETQRFSFNGQNIN